MPPPVAVPPFDPVRRGGTVRQRLRSVLRGARRSVGASLLLLALVVGALGWAGGPGPAKGASEAAGAGQDTGPPTGSEQGVTPEAVAAAGPGEASATARSGPVRVPVRIADAGVVGLLKPGDRVDVLAPAPEPGPGAETGAGVGAARVLAHRVTVAQVPGLRPGDAGGGVASDPAQGALVVLSVPPDTAARLAGAAAHVPLAVALW